jgi:hypothetical protein
MIEGLGSAIGHVLTVAVTVYFVRFVLSIPKEESPQVRDDTLHFHTRWRVRLVGLIATVMSAVGFLGSRSLIFEERNYVLAAVPVLFLILGMWVASGVVTLDSAGITRKVLGFVRSFRWEEITEIEFFQRHHAIRLRAGSHKMTIGGAYVAPRKLLDEITRRTGLEPHMR